MRQGTGCLSVTAGAYHNRFLVAGSVSRHVHVGWNVHFINSQAIMKMLREFNFLNSINIFLSSKCLDLNLFFAFCYFNLKLINFITNSTIDLNFVESHS